MSDNKILEGMARAAHATTFDGVHYENEEPIYRKIYEDKMRAALLWLADNVSDEMVSALADRLDIYAQYNIAEQRKAAIAAALRQAAGGER